MFFDAQIATQELKRGNDNSDKQGHIYLYSEDLLGADNLTSKQTLKYIKYSSDDPNENTFKKKLAENAKDIREYFSVNPEGQLVLASLVTTTVTTESKTDGNLFPTKSSNATYQATEVAIDYKSMISQYATPMSFYLELGMVTRNPVFLEEVVKLVKSKTNIQLTVLNTVSTDTTTQVDTETVHTRGRVKAGNGVQSYIIPYSDDTTTTTTTTTNRVTITPTVKVTSVDTWLCKQEINYNKIEGNAIESDQDPIERESEEEKSLSDDPQKIESVSWTTREPSTVHNYTRTDSYDSGIASDYEDVTDEFIKLLDKEYKIPNSKEKRTAGAYLKTDAELFFQLLSQNPETQGMEQVMRYIMQKYTGEDYGAEDFDFSMFDVGYFTPSSGGELSPFVTDSNLTREEFISLATAYSSSSDYVNYMLKYAGDFYDICTSHNINPTIAYAHACLETSNGSSSACKNNKNYFGYAHGNNASSGKKYNSVSESIEDYCQWVINNSTQGTSAYENTMQVAREYAAVNSKLNGTPDKNIYALYCRYAYLGNTHIADEPDFSNPAGQSYYESHGSNWGSGGRIYIYYMYEKGGLYTDEYSKRCGHSKGTDATTVIERADYAVYATNKRINIAKAIFGNNCLTSKSGSLVAAAYEVAEHFTNGVNVHYAGNSVNGATNNGRICVGSNIQSAWDLPVQDSNKYGIVCATFVNFALWKAGLIDEATINQYNFNECRNLENMLTKSAYASQWQKIDNTADLQEGDIVFINGHVYIYMSGGKCLDQNFCTVQANGGDTRGRLLTASLKEFRSAYRYIGE